MTHHPDDKAVSTSEMLVNIYQSAWCNNPEGSIFILAAVGT
jgi:hypothetical protein